MVTLPSEGTTVEQLVGAMTGASTSARGTRMSVITPDDAAVDVADEPQQSLIKRITSVQSVSGVLVVIVAFFSVTAGERFFSTSNFSLISQNIAVWAVLGVGMTFVIITSGIDLSIGSVLVFSSVVSALVMQRIGGEGWGLRSSASSPHS